MTYQEAYLEIVKLLGLMEGTPDDVVEAVRRRVAPDKFTLVAYSESWRDRYEDAYYRSQLEHLTDMTEQELENAMVRLELAESKIGSSYDEMLIFPTIDQSEDETETWDDWVRNLKERVKVRVKERERLFKEEAQRQEQLKQQRAKAAQETRERAQYDQLRAKFGGGTDGK